MSNSYGKLFRITTFGESHGAAVGVIVDGCPAGLEITTEEIQEALDRRRPGQSKITTPRKEEDRVTILSGVFEGKTLGTPIAMVVNNKDQASKDYSHIEHAFRPSHADYTYTAKYGLRDYRGGGRSSARETVARVAAGALAAKMLQQQGISIQAYVSQVGKIKLQKPYTELDLSQIDSNIVRCPDGATASRMIGLIEEVRDSLDTIGGVVSCVIKGVPVGLGEPVFDKLHAEMGKAMLSINAVKGFECGSGFEGVKMRGSEHNDQFYTDEEGNVHTRTNNSGGVQGGISNGQDIYFNVAFKPVATILQPQQTINDAGEDIELKGKGRHDPCVLPRAVPIVDAMAALVLADLMLRQKANKL
ncbi:chorismate synthase [Pontibacter ummariensis]|uniref:Chorismate synthase n=1 Tax=Pontibacter ummariensis TaxID=1610492 RepID=A0A239B456_9BACT|nr:chorismate synthase [Pontibacter ummariensis]PRY16291.1 chorismate synthase [Pontibacter ummariensis]SNS02629.1 chorismate synthase [Pontibacter ummariensis]